MPDQRCGPLAAWTRAWVVGRVSLDQVLDAVRDADAPHQVTGMLGADHDVQGTTVPLHEVLIAWRRDAIPVQVVLPVPGDVRGLPGPPSLRADALEIGEVALAPGLAVVPHLIDNAPSSAPATVLWSAYACDAPPVDALDLRQAQYDLTTAIRESAAALAGSAGATMGREIAELLSGARRAGERLNLPPGHPAPAVALLAQAERLRAVLDLVAANAADGPLDRPGSRHDALRPLATAVRRARMAAYNA